MVNFENKLIIKVIIITFIMLFVTKQGIFFKFFNKMFLYFNNRYNILKIKELHRKNVLLKIFFFISLEYLCICVCIFSIRNYHKYCDYSILFQRYGIIIRNLIENFILRHKYSRILFRECMMAIKYRVKNYKWYPE